MVVNKNMLDGIAGFLNGESYTVPGYVTFGTTAITVNPTMTDLTGEQASRMSVSSARDNNIVTFTGVRSGTTASPAGDTLYSSALFDASTGGNIQSAVTLPGLLQTTGFDVEDSWDISLERD